MKQRIRSTVQRSIRAGIKRFGFEVIRGPEEDNTTSKVVYLKSRFDSIQDIPGDVVECGVGKGNSFFKLCYLAQVEGRNRTVWGFDSFEGFPAPAPEDASPRNPKAGDWKVATVDSMYRRLALSGLLDRRFLQNNVRLMKGFFDQSLVQYSGSQVAFLHLDVDLYESYKTTLEFFWPRVAPGGVVLFDEYRQEKALRNWPGASKAIDEFLGGLRSQIQHDPYVDRYFIRKQ